MDVTIYYNSRCSKCRVVLKYLASNGFNPKIKNYLEDGLKIDELRDLLKMLSFGVREIIRTNEIEYREQNLKDADDSELLEAVTHNPKLLQRPIIIIGERALIARGSEQEIADFLKG